MKTTLAKWLRERAKRHEAYERAQGRAQILLFNYDRTGEGLQEICKNTLELDRLYLAWCETDHWETTP